MWHVVVDECCSDPSPENRVWTVSEDPTKPGWNTDSGSPGYGLTKAKAEELVRAANLCCDPAADKVLAAIQECDLVLLPMSALREVFSLAHTYTMQVPTRNPQRRMAIAHAFEECRKAVGEVECLK